MKPAIKKNVEKIQKSNRYTIIDDKEILKISDRTSAQIEINKLQQLQKPLIILLDEKSKTSVHFKKTQHQKNYRILHGDYPKDLPTETESKTLPVSE